MGWIVSIISSSVAVASASGLLATSFGFAAFLSDSVETKKRDAKLKTDLNALETKVLTKVSELKRETSEGFSYMHEGFASKRDMNEGFVNLNTNFAAISRY
jgi:hypothetical protein